MTQQFFHYIQLFFFSLELSGISASAYLGHKLGVSDTLISFATHHPYISLFASIAVPTASIFATVFIPKEKVSRSCEFIQAAKPKFPNNGFIFFSQNQKIAKHVALGCTVLSLGIPLSPIVTYIPSDILGVSLLTTGGVVGLLSATALVAPNSTFLKYGGNTKKNCAKYSF